MEEKGRERFRKELKILDKEQLIEILMVQMNAIQNIQRDTDKHCDEVKEKLRKMKNNESV